MDDAAKVLAVEEIKKLKARYFRAIDTKDWSLLEQVFTDDATCDYRGAATDPSTGTNAVPVATETVLQGKAAILASLKTGLAEVVTVHMGYMPEIEVTSGTGATAIWAMSDTLRFPAGGALGGLSGSGHYHETYERIDGKWRIKALRLTRLRVDVVEAR